MLKNSLTFSRSKTLIIFIVMLVSMFPLIVKAEIFKCVEAGKTVFSDKPCADDAEKLELKVYQPKAEDIRRQKQTTRQYQKDSKHNAFLTLRSENEKLRQQIIELQKEHDRKLQEMRSKTYRSGANISTNERGLFKRMSQLSADYRARIKQLETQIRQNEHKMAQLQSGQ